MSKAMAALRVKEQEREITRLFGETIYRVERTACRGKYHGHNDYSLVFGSGRRLYIGLDRANYAQHLREHLEQIRYFRAHQAENAVKIKAALLENDTPFCDATLEVVPYDGSNDLCVYAAVILKTECGIRFLYRETGMHCYLTGCKGEWCSFEHSMDNLIRDLHGNMSLTRPVLDPVSVEKGA